MAGLEDLFDASDYKKKEKGGKKGSKAKDTKKEQKEKQQRNIRYPLPVRVRSGHICCDLLTEEYEGKTVSETDIKNRIRECYPELSGIQFNLVKFSNTYTALLEKQEEMQALKLSVSDREKPEEVESSALKEALDFAPAEQEEDPVTETEPEGMEEPEYEEAESVDDEELDGEEEDDADGENGAAGSDDITAVTQKGCWIKLEIHYQGIADDQKVTFPVSVTVGSTVMRFEENTESVREVRERWTSAHPEYAGCQFHYDDRQNMLIPYMRGESEIKGRKYKLPVTVGYLHLTECYDVQDFESVKEGKVTQAQVRELYAKKHPEFENAIFSYTEEGNYLFPVLDFKKDNTTDRYCLPMLVRGPGFTMTLEQSDFKGKTDATLQEIREAIESVYPEFSKERTEMVYDERGFVVPILKGSRKGISITSDRKGQHLFFVTGRNGASYRIEQMPYGTFDCRADGSEADFHLSADKIPQSMLQDILMFFKKNSNKEAAVQVFYDMGTKKYELYYPEQRVSACSVVFERNRQLEEDKVLVMDAHSHGYMRAFFSSVDDHDEKGTRLFLVAGSLNRKEPEWRLRAGIAGFYKDLQMEDVFENGGRSDEM